MSMNDYNNKILRDLQYWQDLNEAKLPDARLIDSIPPLSCEDSKELPQSVIKFYVFGKWFIYFFGNVVVPYIRVLNLFTLRHISYLFKALCRSQDLEEPVVTANEVFCFLKNIHPEDLHKICACICKNRRDSDNLIASIVEDDAGLFIEHFYNLNLSGNCMSAFDEIIRIIKNIEFFKSFLFSDEDSELSLVSFILQSHLSEVSPDFKGRNLEPEENPDYYRDMILALHDLVKDKNDTELHVYISNNFNSEDWMQLALRMLLVSVYNVSWIWESLTQEEKYLSDEILYPEKDLALIVNGERVFPSQEIIKIVQESQSEWCNDMSASIVAEDDCASVVTSQDNITIHSKDTRHFDFPTRLISEVEPTGMNSDDRIKILTYVFKKLLPGNFLDVTVEDFIYLFGGSKEVPKSYHLPFVWDGEDAVIKALFRIFYIPNKPPKYWRELIITKYDKDRGIAKHNWAWNKNAVAFEDLERGITNFIFAQTGKELKQLPPRKKK